MPGAAAPVVAAAPCPGTTFGAFLVAFAEQPAFRREYTACPISYITVEDGPDGRAPRERRVPSDSVSEPLFLSAADRARDSLVVRIDRNSVGRRVFVLVEPDTGDQLEYTFERRPDGCWQLTRYDDQSR